MIPLIIAILVVVWVWRTGRPWSEFGLARPRNWPLTIATGIVLGIAFKFCMKAIVMPLLGADPVNQAYRHLTGNPAALPGMIATILISAAFGEEVFFRGILFERFGKMLGTRPWGVALTIVIAAVVFGLAHYGTQGWPGVQQAIISGLVFGAIYARTRSLWMLMIAHAAFDLTAVWMIYYGLEERIAHFIFK
jgi:membrane protease YdiL (CAAX protease family)